MTRYRQQHFISQNLHLVLQITRYTVRHIPSLGGDVAHTPVRVHQGPRPSAAETQWSAHLLQPDIMGRFDEDQVLRYQADVPGELQRTSC